jgi:alcohol dehydrogenase class IV
MPVGDLSPPFEFATATRIVFGLKAAQTVASAAKEMGRRAVIVTGRSTDRAASLAADLKSEVFTIPGEPTITRIDEGVQLARRLGADVIIGFGGGSAIDAGKAIAALMTNGGEALDYLEVVGAGKPLVKPSTPFIAIPTTAGTGSEVTRNAVLASPEHQLKASLRSPHMLPRLAVVDPQLTIDLPPEVTASTGLDALTQLIEPYASNRANPITDMFCIEGIRRVRGSLLRAYENGQDCEARTDMAMASLLGGLALANAGLGAVHGFAAPIGGMFPAPHGAICAALLPHAMEVNVHALRQRAPQSDALRRYETIAQLLTGNPKAYTEEGIEWVTQLCTKLSIPPLSTYGIGKPDVATLAEKAAQASSMKANPIVLTAPELADLVSAAL